VADGVGGWREYGVDPSQVPRTIMSLCSRLVQQGRFDPQSPEKLLENAYEEASLFKEAVIGKANGCNFALTNFPRMQLWAAVIQSTGCAI